MRKVASAFVFAVFVPSLMLAWLAVRSLCDQELVLERQRFLLYQNVADTLARNAEATVLRHQHEFGAEVESMLAGTTPEAMAPSFDDQLRTNWPLAEVGFVVNVNRGISCPLPSTDSRIARLFLANNGSFLANRESAEVYWSAANTEPAATQVPADSGFKNPVQNSGQNIVASKIFLKNVVRNVVPQEQRPADSASQSPQIQQFSKVAPADAEFQQLIGNNREGTLARFVNNRLNVLLWHRPPDNSNYIFGAQLALPRLVKELRGQTDAVDISLRQDICVAVLDDAVRPVALSEPKFRANWKHPFVSTEIGEELPHWEVAVYLLNPMKLNETAQTIKLILGLMIGVLVLAISIGSWLIAHSVQKELRLARQKTDFVSNVSHELKTPLTSIRMFSELLAEGRVTDSNRQKSYLNIITAETARLTRLINNVLDFSRMERGEKKYNLGDADLAAIVRDTCESYRPHLENNGFKLACDLPDAVVPVRADGDAIAQVIVNLLSNAEKYGHPSARSDSLKTSRIHESGTGTLNCNCDAPPQEGDRSALAAKATRASPPPDITISLIRKQSPLPHAELRILDRGPGVPRGSEEKIFEQFYRANDLLSSGIQGSGLGLTLARKIARAHGGDVVYEPREGGGSCFCLRLPIINHG